MARILITNDDGIDAPGIQELGRAVHSAGHDVVMVAPLNEASGPGAAIGFILDGTRIRYEQRDIAGLEGCTTVGVEGPPARCVLLAFLGAFGERPDLVLSGINPGVNTGRGLLHSGTVGAVLSAADFGISGMAVSIDCAMSHHTASWETANAVVLRSLPYLLEAPRKTALNVNVPDLAEPAGFAVTRQGKRRYGDAVIEKYDPRGRKYYWIGGVELDYQDEPGTDFSAIHAGLVSVTPLHLDLTNYEAMDSVKAMRLAWP